MSEDMRDPNKAVERPCIKCGAAERNANKQCSVCVRARAAAWRKANPERCKKQREKWATENPEKVKASAAKWDAANIDHIRAARVERYARNPAPEKAARESWYRANKEKVRANGAARHLANPEAARLKNHVRRARKQDAGGTLSRGLVDVLFRLQRGLCPCCGEPLGERFQLDHVMPLALGGTNTDDNMQLLRAACNRKKHAKHPVEYMQEMGFLL